MNTSAPAIISAPDRQTVSMNFIDRRCHDPMSHTGHVSKAKLPVESLDVTMHNANALAAPPRLDAEGFCRVAHPVDLSGLTDSREATLRYRDALIPLIKDISGADEVLMFPTCVVRREQGEDGPDRKYPAGFAHSDLTESGAADIETFMYPPRRAGRVTRVAHYNLWRLLSGAPTRMPLALADVRSVRKEDVIHGHSYYPKVDKLVGTGFYHPNSHFRWIYFPDVRPDELIMFKAFDSDCKDASQVPHVAFDDPSCPQDAAPRISIEARCLARWYA